MASRRSGLAKWWFCFFIRETKRRFARARCVRRYVIAGKTTRPPAREVVGLSTDSVESHKNFADHHDLPLRLLCRYRSQSLLDAYGAKSIIPGKVARSVFVVDRKGVIRYRDVRPLGLFRPK